MPKPPLVDEDEKLCSEIIETFLEGLKQWRPDLSYPESHSDMKGGVMALLRMFEIKRRPIAKPNRIECHVCKGQKRFTTLKECSPDGSYTNVGEKDCPVCKRVGYLERY